MWQLVSIDGTSPGESGTLLVKFTIALGQEIDHPTMGMPDPSTAEEIAVAVDEYIAALNENEFPDLTPPPLSLEQLDALEQFVTNAQANMDACALNLNKTKQLIESIRETLA